MKDETAQTRRLEELLELWWIKLRYDGSLSKHVTCRLQPREICWVETTYGAEPTNTLLEGMELFALLAHADLVLWKQTFKKIFKPTSRIQTLIDGLFPRSVGFSVRFPWEGVDVSQFTAPDCRIDMASPALREARTLLLSMANARGVRIPEVSVRIVWSGRDMAAFSSKMLQIALTHHVHQQVTTDEYKGLRLRSIRISPCDKKTVPDLPHFLNMANTVDFGVAIESSVTMAPSLRHPAAFVKSMQALYVLGSTTEDIAGIQRVEITNVLAATDFASIYSALHASKSVTSVVINPRIKQVAYRDRPKLWSWIAWALFRREPSHTRQHIRELELNVEYLKEADVEAMKAILDAPDPLVLLMDRTTSLESTTISTRRFTLLDPTKPDTQTSALSTYQSRLVVDGLPVLHVEGQWWTVLLPGWGRAWVHEDDVLAHEFEVTPTMTAKCIPHITLVGMTFGSCQGALSLLRLVGTNLRHIVVVDYCCEQCEYGLDDWIRCVTEMCPWLESLELRGAHLESLDAVIDIFASGKCRVRRLVLVNVSMTEIEACIERFFSVLGDTSHPMARLLDEFVWHKQFHGLLNDAAMLSTITTMLKHNTRLSLLDLQVTDPSPSVVNDDDYRPVNAFNGRVITDRNPQLQIAFLSVITAENERGEEQASARARLDSSVVESILAFAAGTKKRRVYLDAASD